MNNPFVMHVNNHAKAPSENTRLKLKQLYGISDDFKISVKKVAKKSYTFAGIIEGKEFHVGLAICNPADQFVKKVGRLKAEGRARSSKAYVFNIPDDVISSNKTGKFFSQICDDILKSL